MALDPDHTSLKKNKRYTPAFFSQKISVMKNLDNGMETFHAPAEEKALIMAVFRKYEESLARNNAFDFDDLIQKPVQLFRTYPAILQKYQSKFDAILVDEYQDINPKQYELVKFLAGEHRNLSVVGDDEQTIYSWRHADIKTFLNFDKEWSGAQVFFLEENYRSTGNIIRAAAAVAQNNKFRTLKKLWTENEAGELITLFEAWGENDEAAWIADEVKKAEPETTRKEMAILYRTNAQSRAIEQALIRESIPYQIFGGLKFYERREVKDAVAALRFASNDRDEVAKERLEKNLTKRKFGLFKERIAGLKEAKPVDIIKVFLDTFSYFDYLEGGFTNSDEREENIAELINFAAEFKDLPELLERISLLQATDDTKDLAKEKVSLMTIHLAKGLEFDRVFIAGAAEGLLPHIRSIESEASTEEERRLMYVAMTRARKKLSISFFGMPSRFLAEIPEDCIALTVTNNADDETPRGRDDFEENVVEF
jgi:DNA helicase-2/ATP-dependent DNA helicase PcrA